MYGLDVCESNKMSVANKRRKHWTEKREAKRPGEVVSVDQLVSPAPGLVAQITGILTTKRYRYATVYVDQYSGLGYTFLQKMANAEETIEGKKAFEAYCRQNGVSKNQPLPCQQWDI